MMEKLLSIAVFLLVVLCVLAIVATYDSIYYNSNSLDTIIALASPLIILVVVIVFITSVDLIRCYRDKF